MPHARGFIPVLEVFFSTLNANQIESITNSQLVILSQPPKNQIQISHPLVML